MRAITNVHHFDRQRLRTSLPLSLPRFLGRDNLRIVSAFKLHEVNFVGYVVEVHITTDCNFGECFALMRWLTCIQASMMCAKCAYLYATAVQKSCVT